MTLHRRSTGHVPRGTKGTVYIVAAFYVVVGFFLAAGASPTGDRLSAFLAFLIVTGALTAAVLFMAVLKLGAGLSAVREQLDDLRNRLDHAQQRGAMPDVGGSRSSAEGATRTLDLASIGPGDPTLLAAARLDRDVFPRLATAMDEKPPARSESSPSDPRSPPRPRRGSAPRPTPRDPFDSLEIGGGVAARNLLREWKVALRELDLPECRRVLAVLKQTAPPEQVASLEAGFSKLADRFEVALRAQFSKHVRDRDYTGALAVGEHICAVLPDREITKEFNQIKPYLLRRMETPAEKAGAGVRIATP